MNCNFILVLVFAGILCCAAQSRDSGLYSQCDHFELALVWPNSYCVTDYTSQNYPNKSPQSRTESRDSGLYPQRDHFKLALVWPNSYCVTDYRSCRSELPQYFTIKAFSADLGDDRRLENCEKQSPFLTEAMISRHKYDMLNYSPDLSKSTYEDNVKTWKTSGSDMEPVLLTHYQRKITNEHNCCIVPDGKKYSSAKILSALHRNRDTYLNIVCGMDGEGNVYLSEIHQCLDSNANKFVDCENKAINCFDDPIFPGEYNSQPMKVRDTTTTFK
ncbi:hypothetical protein L6164_005667 [Bauhinia variegata]|uniref:Uncharacterized protein n=1 Tax=Bauhinia variegata TaxID=167791 RepID=A0ACB9PS19_BAUVA|nr:hypothetical protein L6164_005667 [Bauhinia variegata]